MQANGNRSRRAKRSVFISTPPLSIKNSRVSWAYARGHLLLEIVPTSEILLFQSLCISFLKATLSRYAQEFLGLINCAGCIRGIPICAYFFCILFCNRRPPDQHLDLISHAVTLQRLDCSLQVRHGGA